MTRVGVLAAAAAAVVVPLAVGGVLAATSGPDGGGGVTFTFRDPEIVESSGLIALDARDGRRFVTVNDSGDAGRVFTVDDDGETVGTSTWGEATDVEALAPWAPDEVLVGDIGDNLGSRDSVELLVVPVGRGDRQVDPVRYELTYPGGPRDAETLAVNPRTREVVVVTKGVFGGDVLVAPAELREDRPNRMRVVGTALGIATDGAFLPDGRHLVVRDYTRAVVYAWPSLREVAELDLPRQPQGEGIAVAPDGSVHVSTEGVRSQVRRVQLPPRVAAVLAPPSPSPTPPPTSPPSTTPPPDGGPAPDLDDGTTAPDPPVWPWAATGLVGLVALVVLLRSLRPR